MTHLQRIQTTLASSPARRSAPGFGVWDLDTGPWWKLFTDWKGLEQTKRAVLAAIWDTPELLFFVPSTTEMATNLKPFLVATDSGAWLVNRERSPEDFYGVDLNEGNWAMYASSHPCRVPLPNTFKTSPPALMRFMREQGVTVLIDAFYDDWEWRVAVAGP